MAHQGLKVYKICINYDSWLALTNLMAMTNLLLSGCSRPIYLNQVSVHRTIGPLVIFSYPSHEDLDGNLMGEE